MAGKISARLGYAAGFDDNGYGVTTAKIKEFPVKGEWLRRNPRLSNSEPFQSNGEFFIGMNFSFIYGGQNSTATLASLLYISIDGIKWKIQSMNIAYPRVTLELGGIYNAG